MSRESPVRPFNRGFNHAVSTLTRPRILGVMGACEDDLVVYGIRVTLAEAVEQLSAADARDESLATYVHPGGVR